MGRLAGKRAIVTGASSGIGRAIANRFAAEGAAVAACGRDPERVQRTVDEIGSAGGTAVGLLGDVATVEGAQSVADGAAEQLGGVDVLVNNAGVDASDWRDLHEWPVEEFDRIAQHQPARTVPRQQVRAAAPARRRRRLDRAHLLGLRDHRLGGRLWLRHLQGGAEHAVRPHRGRVRRRVGSARTRSCPA